MSALEQLLAEPTTMGVRLLPDGRVLALREQLNGYLLTLGDQQELAVGIYGNEWEYADDQYPAGQAIAHAAIALLCWDGQGEPALWSRHRPTGRRRPGGDRQREEVRR